MGKRFTRSTIPGAQPELPTEGKVSDFSEILGTPIPEVEAAQGAPEAPPAAPAAIPTQPNIQAVTEAQGPAIDVSEPEATGPVQGELPGTRRQTMTVQIPGVNPEAQAMTDEQRERERVPTYRERLSLATLAPSVSITNQPVSEALSRAENTNAVISNKLVGRKITAKKRELLEQGTPEAAFAATDAEGNIKVPVNPATRGSMINVGVNAILYDPRILDAGKYNEDTGMLGVDPDLGRIMSLATEGWMHQQMDAATEIAGNLDKETGMPGEYEPGQQGGQRFTKATGNTALGREIFMAYKRHRAESAGLPTDSYLQDIDAISPETFTFLGDMAKEVYAEANPDMVYRDDRLVDQDGQVYFQITPEGAVILDKLSNDFKGLMAQEEVKPLNGVSETAQPVFEGRMRVRSVTTKMGDLEDWSVVQEAMANYHSVKYINDPGRERLAFMFGMLALINTVNPQNQTYADMYDIGLAKLESLRGEKKRLFDAAERAYAEDKPLKAKKLLEKAEAYNPEKILQSIREKFLNVAGATAEYSGKANHLTFSMQALTGRTHVQQTLYNPASHKFLRFIVGGGNVYTWNPNDNGPLDRAWKEIIAAHLLSGEKGGKVYKGTELSTKERLAAFDRSVGTDEWAQFVAWGNQLKAARDNFNIDGAKQAVQAIRTAQDPKQVQAIKQKIMQDFSGDPLDASLKAELARHGTDAPAMAEYFIEIAKYDAALKNKTQFNSNLAGSAVEIDGKTHGPATNAALLGVSSMAKRTGLITTQDFSNTDWLDSRKAMGESMQDELSAHAGTLYKMEHLPAFKEILDLAIQDREHFLKKSPMTMGYGQEIPSLGQHVETTIYSGPVSQQIQKVAAENNIPLDDVLNVLHTMLTDSIFQIMDPKVVAIGRLMKANALMSVATNEVMHFKNAMGFKSYAAAKQMDPEQTTAGAYEFEEDGKRKKFTPYFYKEKTEGSAVRMYEDKAVPGGYTMGRIIPVSVQSYDGNMIAKTGSGESWKRITEAVEKNGGDNVFVLPIFDAFVLDLGSFAAVREESNKNWVEGIRNHSYIEQIADNWYPEVMATVENLPSGNMKINIKEDGPYRGLADMFTRDDYGRLTLGFLLSKTVKAPPKSPGQSIEAYTKSLNKLGHRAAKDFEKRLSARGINVDSAEFTPTELTVIFKELSRTLELSERNKSAAQLTKKDKAELLAQMDRTVSQMDF